MQANAPTRPDGPDGGGQRRRGNAAEQRMAIESLLGRALLDEEALSIRPIPVTKDAPPPNWICRPTAV